MRKFLRAFLAVLILLAMQSSALAQEYFTLPEVREQAAQGWHEVYTDKTGRTIPVDIDVQVFGGEKAPVLKLVFPDYVNYYDDQDEPYGQMVKKARKAGIEEALVYKQQGVMVDLDRAYGEDFGNDINLREVYGFLGEHLEKLGLSIEDIMYDCPQSLQIHCNTDGKTGNVLSKPFYDICLWPQFHELPLMAHVFDGAQKSRWPFYTPQIVISYQSQEAYAVAVDTFEEQEMLTEDIPLCALEKVIESVESYIEAGHIRNVVSLRFGYSLYNDPNYPQGKRSAYDAECYYAVPSWVVECAFSENPSKELKENTPLKRITIDAQTGQMLDPFDTSKDGYANADYRGFIPWEDVN